jgi:Na+/H+ antiporter NhaD/arsenite permease-like protein
MSGDTAEATTVSGLATVIFTSGLLSAFLVNDIVCLVMTPFVLHVPQRLGLPPIPYLLAVATASNIGSTATITGNPQNMLIGSVSGIGRTSSSSNAPQLTACMSAFATTFASVCR